MGFTHHGIKVGKFFRIGLNNATFIIKNNYCHDKGGGFNSRIKVDFYLLQSTVNIESIESSIRIDKIERGLGRA
jgi:hypothetical protein